MENLIKNESRIFLESKIYLTLIAILKFSKTIFFGIIKGLFFRVKSKAKYYLINQDLSFIFAVCQEKNKIFYMDPFYRDRDSLSTVQQVDEEFSNQESPLNLSHNSNDLHLQTNVISSKPEFTQETEYVEDPEIENLLRMM